MRLREEEEERRKPGLNRRRLKQALGSQQKGGKTGFMQTAVHCSAGEGGGVFAWRRERRRQLTGHLLVKEREEKREHGAGGAFLF